jgi:CheY-like chemotaxis protein
MKLLRILIADDSKIIVMTLKAELERLYGYEVEGVYDGTEALARLQENSYDLLYSDNTMPGILGIKLIQLARQLHPNIKTILSSGDDIQDSPADTTLKKPTGLETALEAVRSLLENE